MAYGTLSVLDTLATINATSIVQYGEQNVYDAIATAFAARDAILAEMFNEIADTTADQIRASGGVSTMTAQELDEYGVPAPQKLTAGENYGFPIRRHGNALQWTRDWLNNKTPAEMVPQVNGIMASDREMILKRLQRALFLSTNFTFLDATTNNLSIPVKRLANADSFSIPPAPDGTTFNAATHTHYLARVSTLAASDISGLINTVREHFSSGDIHLAINAASEAAVRAFTSNFFPYYDARLRLADTVTAANGALNVSNTYDRAIGLFDTAEVEVRPWVPANYMCAYIVGGGIAKPVAARSRNGAGLGTLDLVADIPGYPLQAQMWRRDVDFGAQNRVAAAVLFIGGTSYTDPTL